MSIHPFADIPQTSHCGHRGNNLANLCQLAKAMLDLALGGDIGVSGFFNWVRRWRHGESIYVSNEDEPFDDETSALIEVSVGLLERMQSRGVDLSKPRTVTHLFLGTDQNLARAAKLLSQQGYSIDEVGGDRLLLSEQNATTDGWVRQVVPAMCLTAADFDLIYDGWDVDVAADCTGQDN